MEGQVGFFDPKVATLPPPVDRGSKTSITMPPPSNARLSKNADTPPLNVTNSLNLQEIKAG